MKQKLQLLLCSLLLSFGAFSQNIPSYVPTNGLVGWWPFNGNANDESGNGNHGTVNGATLTSDRNGVAGKAYSFDGITNYINVNHSSSLNLGLPMSLSIWMSAPTYSDGGLEHYIVSKFSNSGSSMQGFHMYVGEWITGKALVLRYRNNFSSNWGGTTVSGSVMPASNTWYNAVFTSDGITDKLYLNGALIVSNSSAICGASTNPLLFGKQVLSLNNGAFQGKLDDIAIYNRALSQKEITALYTGVVTKDIFASSGANGTISPSGTTAVNSGSSQTYTFTPNPGYLIDSVIVNGVQIPTASSYTFSNVTSDQTIRVTYRSLAAALAVANICSNDTLVSTVNLPAQSNVRATTYYSNIYLFNQNNTSNAFKYNVNDRKYTAIADKPSPCIECGVAEANGKVYCFNTNGTTQAYDIATNTWQIQANQPNTSTSSVYAASSNNKIYVLGTNNNQNSFTQYNPQTNSYTALANPTINATQSRLVAFNNKLYKIGGTDNNNQPTSSVEVYNPTNNTWTSMPDLPEALTQVGATHYDNKLYVFGGKQANNTNSNKVYVFDFTSNTWYAESNTQNTNRTNIEAKTANNMVFLFGGADTSNSQTNQAQRYFCKDQLCTCKWAEYVCNGVSSDVPCNTLSPSIQTLRQDTTANTGNLYNGIAASNVTVTLNYTGANGASYNARTISSTGVTGLTATLAAGTLNNGNGTLVLTISGTPNTTGTASFSISLGGKTCVLIRDVNLPIGAYRIGTVHCNGTPTSVYDVTNPITGKTWMDRNLGAIHTNLSDVGVFGDLYQWGRFADGHQCRNSATTNTLSTIDKPEHSKFILVWNSPYDWHYPQNDNLWQGKDGINNPCPYGYRIPTKNELLNEKSSWTQNNSDGAEFSPLRLPRAGSRDIFNGTLHGVETYGNYWSSTLNNGNASILSFWKSLIIIYDENKATGFSVRCIKD